MITKILLTIALISLTTATLAGDLKLVSYYENGEDLSYGANLVFPSASGKKASYAASDHWVISGETQSGPMIANLDTTTVERVAYTTEGELLQYAPYIEYMTANTRFYILNYRLTGLDPDTAPTTNNSNFYLYDKIEQTYTAIGTDYTNKQKTLTNAQVSEDGKFVTYLTSAQIFSSADYTHRAKKQLYIYDIKNKTTKLVSKNTNGDTFLRAVSIAGHENRYISGDGKYIVFTSTEASAHPEQHTGSNSSNLFIYNRDLDSLSILNKDDNGTVFGNEFSQATISLDGGHVAAVSNSGIADNKPQTLLTSFGIHYLNIATSKWSYVSISSDGNTTPNYPTSSPSISADGKFISYMSNATNISNIDNKGNSQAYVVNTQNRTSVMVSVSDVTGKGSTKGISQPKISANGEYVFFVTKDNNMIETGTTTFNKTQVYRWKNSSGTSFDEPLLCEF